MADYHRKNSQNDFDERPIEEVWENLFCNPLECDDRIYCTKIKEKTRLKEKIKENDNIFGQNGC